MNPPPDGSSETRTRPLPVLRALIDAVDHEVLQLLGRRNGLVGEIAAFKRAHGIRIRDPQREREIIADRRERAGALGLSPDVIESALRLILWASRDRQAALRAEVPPDMEQRTVAVIGGNGLMGRCIAGLFADLGHAVMIADLDTKLAPQAAASIADVVLISVPIDTTVEVIRQLGPKVRPEALLMDVTSVKTAPVQAMLDSSTASVVGTHPLFGPSVHSVQGQRIVVTPGRGDEWHRWLVDMLQARGLVVKEATPQNHDRAMAVVQVLTHFATEVMGKALADIGVPLRMERGRVDTGAERKRNTHLRRGSSPTPLRPSRPVSGPAHRRAPPLVTAHQTQRTLSLARRARGQTTSHPRFREWVSRRGCPNGVSKADYFGLTRPVPRIQGRTRQS